MKEELQFLEKLNGLRQIAEKNGQRIRVEEVKEYFKTDELTEEQFALVFDYLLAQKVVVQGYLKKEEALGEEVVLTEEEKHYLREYELELSYIRAEEEGERQALFQKAISQEEQAKARLTELYLKEVIEVAKEMKQPELYLGDLVQEGNVGLMIAVSSLTDPCKAHDHLISGVREAMQMYIEECAETKKRDHKMVHKVEELDRSITELTKELGRKVTIDELVAFTGIEEEEVEDLLRLLGEDAEEEEQE